MTHDFDMDMKIFGEQSLKNGDSSAELYGETSDYEKEKSGGGLKKAAKLGLELANEFVKVCRKDELTISENDSESLMLQRTLLLSFTVMAGLEKFCRNMAIANAARTEFFNCLSTLDRELFSKSSDTGAFSFYYLSFRCGTDVDRRVGQTFAMLCSHDGDPIYQELGEALYCWFISVVQKKVSANGLDK